MWQQQQHAAQMSWHCHIATHNWKGQEAQTQKLQFENERLKQQLATSWSTPPSAAPASQEAPLKNTGPKLPKPPANDSAKQNDQLQRGNTKPLVLTKVTAPQPEARPGDEEFPSPASLASYSETE
eukprot:8131141-Pyramimonas_sp.AAC.1